MRDLKTLRDVQHREARRAMGVNSTGPTHQQAHTIMASFEAEIVALPIAGEASPIQNPDSSFVFMVGMSLVDGPDGVA